MNLYLVTPPSIEPVTLADVKLHTHIGHSVEDGIINNWITAARILAENYQRRAYIGQIWEMAFDCFPELPIYFPRAPLIGLMTIKCYDQDNAETVVYDSVDNPITTTEEPGTEPSTNANYFVDENSEPGRLNFAYGKTWPSITPRSMSAVKIRFAAGYGLTAADVPATVKDAIYLYCAYRNENRAGEIERAPRQFYDILTPDRIWM